MTTKKRWIITAAALVIVLGLFGVGVWAALPSTFRITNRITFVADGVSVDVSVSGTNRGKAINIPNNEVYLNGSEELAEQTIVIPDQIFAGSGESKKIVYTINFTNVSSETNLQITSPTFTSTNKIRISATYRIGGTTYESDEGINIAYPGETYTVTVTYVLLSESSNVDYTPSLDFSLDPTNEERDEPEEEQPGYIEIVSRFKQSFRADEDITNVSNHVITISVAGLQGTILCSDQNCDISFSPSATSYGTLTATLKYYYTDKIEHPEDYYTTTFTVTRNQDPISSIIINSTEVYSSGSNYYQLASNTQAFTVAIDGDSTNYDYYYYNSSNVATELTPGQQTNFTRSDVGFSSVGGELMIFAFPTSASVPATLDLACSTYQSIGGLQFVIAPMKILLDNVSYTTASGTTNLGLDFSGQHNYTGYSSGTAFYAAHPTEAITSVSITPATGYSYVAYFEDGTSTSDIANSAHSYAYDSTDPYHNLIYVIVSDTSTGEACARYNIALPGRTVENQQSGSTYEDSSSYTSAIIPGYSIDATGANYKSTHTYAYGAFDAIYDNENSRYNIALTLSQGDNFCVEDLANGDVTITGHTNCYTDGNYVNFYAAGTATVTYTITSSNGLVTNTYKITATVEGQGGGGGQEEETAVDAALATITSGTATRYLHYYNTTQGLLENTPTSGTSTFGNQLDIDLEQGIDPNHVIAKTMVLSTDASISNGQLTVSVSINDQLPDNIYMLTAIPTQEHPVQDVLVQDTSSVALSINTDYAYFILATSDQSIVYEVYIFIVSDTTDYVATFASGQETIYLYYSQAANDFYTSEPGFAMTMAMEEEYEGNPIDVNYLFIGKHKAISSFSTDEDGAYVEATLTLNSDYSSLVNGGLMYYEAGEANPTTYTSGTQIDLYHGNYGATIMLVNVDTNTGNQNRIFFGYADIPSILTMINTLIGGGESGGGEEQTPVATDMALATITSGSATRYLHYYTTTTELLENTPTSGTSTFGNQLNIDVQNGTISSTHVIAKTMVLASEASISNDQLTVSVSINESLPSTMYMLTGDPSQAESLNDVLVLDTSSVALSINTDYAYFILATSDQSIIYEVYIFIVSDPTDYVATFASGLETIKLYYSATANDFFTDTPGFAMTMAMEEEDNGDTIDVNYLFIGKHKAISSFSTDEDGAYVEATLTLNNNYSALVNGGMMYYEAGEANPTTYTSGTQINLYHGNYGATIMLVNVDTNTGNQNRIFFGYADIPSTLTMIETLISQ